MAEFTEEDERMLRELQARKAAANAYVDELVQFKGDPSQITSTPIPESRYQRMVREAYEETGDVPPPSPPRPPPKYKRMGRDLNFPDTKEAANKAIEMDKMSEPEKK